MGIFGKLDAAAVPANPFWVAAGEYSAEVTKAEYSVIQKGNNAGTRQIHIEYTINDEAYLDSRLHQYFALVDEDMTEEMFEMLPDEEKNKLRKANAKIKQTLCGNGTNQPGLGVDEMELNDDNWDPKSLVGTKVDIAVANGGDKNQYVNIRWVNKQEA